MKDAEKSFSKHLSTWTKVFRYFALLKVGLQPTG